MAALIHRKSIPSRSVPITARTVEVERDRRLLVTIAVSATLLTATALHALLTLAP